MKFSSPLHNPDVTLIFNTAIQLRQEVENSTARLHYISEAHQTVKDDIAITKRAAEKTTTDVTKAGDDKLKQVCRSCSIRTRLDLAANYI